MNKIITSAVFFTLFLLSGCGVSTTRPIDSTTAGVKRIDAMVEYIGPNFERLKTEQYPNDIVLAFPYIPGAIYGNPKPVMVFVKRVSGGLTFSLDLEKKYAQMDKLAAPLEERWKQSGLSIKPENARIARLGTFPYDPGTRKTIGGGGFIDPVSRNLLILVYVDRPCEITGTFTLRNEQNIHRLKFYTRGFHWIQVVQSPGKDTYLQNYPDNGKANFSIHIENLRYL